MSPEPSVVKNLPELDHSAGNGYGEFAVTLMSLDRFLPVRVFAASAALQKFFSAKKNRAGAPLPGSGGFFCAL